MGTWGMDAMKPPDRAREDRLRGGLASDLEATFPQLVIAYQDRLYTFALRTTGNPRDAEEIAQDAFVRAYRALRGYPADRVRALALNAWLYRITLNVTRNRLRKKQLPTVSIDQENDDAPLHLPDDESLSPEALFERDEERNALEVLLAALPARYRVAVILRHVMGLSYTEVAEILKQPAGTTKANVHRGIQLLRAGLAERVSVDHSEWRNDDGQAESILAPHGATVSRGAPRSS